MVKRNEVRQPLSDAHSLIIEFLAKQPWSWRLGWHRSDSLDLPETSLALVDKIKHLLLGPQSADFIIDGLTYRIQPASCRCGGSWAWVQVVDGVELMVGCICHRTPTPQRHERGTLSHVRVPQYGGIATCSDCYVAGKYVDWDTAEIVNHRFPTKPRE